MSTVLVVWLLVRMLPALPAFFGGRRPARTAAAFAWRVSQRRFWRLLTRLGAAALVIAATRAALAGTLFLGASTIIDRIAAGSTSLRPVIVATAIAGTIGGALDVVTTFLGFAWLAALLTQFYLEAAGGASRPDAQVAPDAAMAWITGRQLAVAAVAAMIINVVATLTTLERSSQPPDFLVIAHRASPVYAPENTLLALERAIAAQSDYAEIDVQRTRDGVVVVVHDADLMRLAGDARKIAETDYAAFADVRFGSGDRSDADERRLARLDEFLDRANGRIRLAIELKYYGWDPLLAQQVLAEIRARNAEQQVMIISLSLQAIEQVRGLASDIATGYLSSVAVGSLARLHVDALALSRQRSTAQIIREAHAHQREVYVWTVNDAAGMVELVGRGADGIITDDPIVGARVRRELQSLTSTELLLLRFSDALTDQETRDELETVQ